MNFGWIFLSMFLQFGIIDSDITGDIPPVLIGQPFPTAYAEAGIRGDLGILFIEGSGQANIRSSILEGTWPNEFMITTGAGLAFDQFIIGFKWTNYFPITDSIGYNNQVFPYTKYGIYDFYLRLEIKK